MASDAYRSLSRLLLQQSDVHPIRSVSGEDLVEFDDRVVLDFEAAGLLVRQPDLRDADGVVIAHDGKETCVLTSLDEVKVARIDPRAIRCYDIDFGAIARLLRKNARLEGPPVELVGHQAFALGTRGKGTRRQCVYLVRAVRPERVADVLCRITRHAGATSAVLLLTARRIELSDKVLREFEHLELIALDDCLKRLAKPFAIAIPGMKRAGNVRGGIARLIIDVQGHTATFDGEPLDLEKRDFAVLVLLANEASDQSGYVLRDHILDALQNATGKSDSKDEQVDRSASRIRNALKAVDPSTNWVEAKRKVGFRLTLKPSQIHFE